MIGASMSARLMYTWRNVIIQLSDDAQVILFIDCNVERMQCEEMSFKSDTFLQGYPVKQGLQVGLHI